MTERIHDLGPGDVEALQALLESAPDYAARITGYPPGPSDAFSVLTTLPPGLDAANKHAIGLWEEGELLAFTDVLFGYPDPEVIYVGLLIARRDHRGKGLGHELHDAILQRALKEPAFTRMRLGIVQTNAKIAEPFWRRRGYRPTGDGATPAGHPHHDR